MDYALAGATSYLTNTLDLAPLPVTPEMEAAMKRWKAKAQDLQLSAIKDKIATIQSICSRNEFEQRQLAYHKDLYKLGTQVNEWKPTPKSPPFIPADYTGEMIAWFANADPAIVPPELQHVIGKAKELMQRQTELENLKLLFDNL